MSGRINKEKINLRFNIVVLIVYITGIILITQLFNLQIVKGEEYREQSNTRLTRESTVKAARGDILDRTGEKLATVTMGFGIELYKTKVDDNTLNNSLLELVNILIKNGQKYPDSFPISINPYQYSIEGEELSKWKKKYKVDEQATAEEAFLVFKKKYKINNENIEDIRKIIAIRYEITTNGYSNVKPITISKNVSREVVAELSERSGEFPGINIVTTSSRNYTSANLASHILGYVNKISSKEYASRKDKYTQDDVIGKTGVESVFEDYLKGEDGKKAIYMSVDGAITGEDTIKDAVSGANVVLTIDAKLQNIAENALAANIEKIKSGGFGKTYDAHGGSVVVMNSNTGEVLAMASYPDYEPQLFVGGISTENWNKYRDDEGHPLLNKAVQSAYAPGSIFKMVTATAALESGIIEPNTKINATGKYPKYENPECWYYTQYHRGHGRINVSEAIKKSCNYFFYQVADNMGIDEIAKYAKYYGLGTKTGIELPDETSGTLASKETKAILKPKEIWYPGETLSAAIGQSYNSFSPIQIAKYLATLVNGGNQINPTIIKSVINSDGSTVSDTEIKNYVNQKLGITQDEREELSISQENIDVILEGMRSVAVEAGGTAYNVFKDFNIEIGGKTGSAEAGNDVNAWFVGFAPYDNPEIVVVVMVENGGHGNYTAEVTREIMAEYFGMNSNNVEESTDAMPVGELLR